MANIFERLAYQATESATRKIGGLSSNALKYTAAARNLLNGNLAGAAGSLLDTVYGPASHYGAGNVVLARSSWAAMEQVYNEAQAVLRERTNLWHVLVEPIGKTSAPRVNLLAQEVSYNGLQLGYDTRKIGSGFTQAPSGAGPVELTLTTLDSDGEIKAWMERLKALHAHPDGTFGLLSDYANKFTLTHGAFEEGRGYAKSWVLVPVDYQVSMNRAVEEFATVNLTFTQAESFGAL